MTKETAVKLAADDIWMSMKRFGRPDQVHFVGYL